MNNRQDNLDQSLFVVDEQTFAVFERLLHHPLPPTDALRRLLRAKPPWPEWDK